MNPDDQAWYVPRVTKIFRPREEVEVTWYCQRAEMDTELMNEVETFGVLISHIRIQLTPAQVMSEQLRITKQKTE